MSTHIALLRGINVGGRNMIAMADLRGLMEDLGLSGAKSLLQSGNLVFDSPKLGDDALERLLEQETAKRLKVAADYMVRSDAELKKIIARNPFPREAKDDPSHLLVMFLKAAASKEKVEALQSSIKGPEMVHRDGRHLYIVYPAGIGRSKLTGTLIEKSLGLRGTARNWNTVLKLAALCQ